MLFCLFFTAVIAQLGERKTEDLKVSGSIPDCGRTFVSGSRISMARRMMLSETIRERDEETVRKKKE